MTQYRSDDAHFSFEDSRFRIPGPPARPLKAQWHGRNQAVTVAGLSIPSGMVYVGEHFPGKDGTPNPCLIDSLKAVDLRADYNQAHAHDDRPVYADMSPSARGAYLKWLADGRSGPGADSSKKLTKAWTSPRPLHCSRPQTGHQIQLVSLLVHGGASGAVAYKPLPARQIRQYAGWAFKQLARE